MANTLADAKPLLIPSTAPDLPLGWAWKRLDDVCVGVFDCPHSTPKLTAGGPFVVRSQDMRSGVFRTDNAGRVSEETYLERIQRAEPTHGDLLYSREGTYFGIAAEVPPSTKVCLGQRMVLIRPNPDQLHFRFLRYWLNSPTLSGYVYGHRDGTVAERLNLPTIRGLPVALPSLAEQRAIAHILGALDDKIELNRRMNETLEAIARAIFKSWFVDFDPVRAKLALSEANGMEGRQPAGMDAETAALFPDSFEDSLLGKIPQGWQVVTIAETCSISRGASPRPIIDFVGEDVPWIKIADATSAGGPFIFTTNEKIRKEGVSKSVSVGPGDLILSNSATCGIPVFVEIVGCIHDGWLLFRDFKLVSKGFLFHHLSHITERLVHIADGSVQKNLNTKLVGDQKVVVPTREIVSAFDAIHDGIYAMIRENTRQSRTLAAIRDVLLPKLLSGEVRVKDAAHILESRL